MKNNETDTDLEITYLWGNPNSEEALSDDPLADLLNEFGTEDLEEEEESSSKELVDRSPETSSIKEVIEDENRDYFYKVHFSKEEFQDDLEELQYLLKKTEYLAQKLKYYNNIIQK